MKHFTLKELLASCDKMEVANGILKGYVDNALKLCEILDKIRDNLGIPLHITSSYRDAAHNRVVGGAPNSQHMLGQAIDFQPLKNADFRKNMDVLYGYFQALAFESIHNKPVTLLGQVILYDNFIHISSPSINHKSICIYDKRNS